MLLKEAFWTQGKCWSWNLGSNAIPQNIYVRSCGNLLMVWDRPHNVNFMLYGMLVPGLLPERRSCHTQYATHAVHVVSKRVKETSGSCCRYCASVSFFLAHGPTCKRVKSNQKKPLPKKESVRCGMLLQLKDWAANLGFSQSKWLKMKLWWTVQPPVCCLTWSGWTLGYFGPWLMGSNIFEYRVPGCVVPHVSLCKMLQSVSKHNSKCGAAVSAMLDPASLAHSQKKDWARIWKR